MPIAVPTLRAPIVLVHGLLGFKAVQVAGRHLFSYFPGVAGLYESAGNRVYAVTLSPTAGIATRAAELREHLRNEMPPEPVHIIAHSMGGLDARYMISKLGMADRVLSLTTLGTPHRGSSFADWGIRRVGSVVKPVLRLLRFSDQAFYDLTTESCARFNEDVPDAPGVSYYSVAGKCTTAWVGLEWQLPHYIVSRAEGPNDGIVSVASATYGSGCEIWHGDHMSLVNWPNLQACALGLWRNRLSHYAKLSRRLAEIEDG